MTDQPIVASAPTKHPGTSNPWSKSQVGTGDAVGESAMEVFIQKQAPFLVRV